LGYNAEDKLMIGISGSAKTFGFRKDPYASYQKLSSLYAINNGSYQLKYQGIFNSVFMKKDLVLDATLVDPTLNNFFGFGNSTTIDPNKPIEFYRVRYKYVQADLLVRKRLSHDILSISFGPAYFHYWSRLDDNANKILGKPSQ